jgi:hypothetical protein
MAHLANSEFAFAYSWLRVISHNIAAGFKRNFASKYFPARKLLKPEKKARRNQERRFRI